MKRFVIDKKEGKGKEIHVGGGLIIEMVLIQVWFESFLNKDNLKPYLQRKTVFGQLKLEP